MHPVQATCYDFLEKVKENAKELGDMLLDMDILADILVGPILRASALPRSRSRLATINNDKDDAYAEEMKIYYNAHIGTERKAWTQGLHQLYEALVSLVRQHTIPCAQAQSLGTLDSVDSIDFARLRISRPHLGK